MNKVSHSELKESLKADRIFQAEKVKLDFAMALWRFMRNHNVNQAQMAAELGTSQPWISKVLRGDSNMTISTMAALAEAAGGELCLHIRDRHARMRWIEIHDGGRKIGSGAWAASATRRASVTPETEYAPEPIAA